MHLLRHANSAAHKFAEASWFRPDEPVCIACNATVEDDQVEPKLTKRRRPSYQVESAGASTPGQKPRRQSDALESICQIRTLPVQRKSWKALCVAMAEVVRDRKRDALRAATALSIAFDD